MPESGNVRQELLLHAVKYAVMMHMAPNFSGTVCSRVLMQTVPVFEQPCCSGVTPLETLERIRPRHLQL